MVFNKTTNEGKEQRVAKLCVSDWWGILWALDQFEEIQPGGRASRIAREIREQVGEVGADG